MVQIQNEESGWSKVDGLARVVIASYLPLRKKLAWRGCSPTHSFHFNLFCGRASAQTLNLQRRGTSWSPRDLRIALWLMCVITAPVMAQIEQTPSPQLYLNTPSEVREKRSPLDARSVHTSKHNQSCLIHPKLWYIANDVLLQSSVLHLYILLRY